ncbi:GIY-YIG nuclease family protein [Streptomyces sp. NPDC051643]|uniref:GIY-YIG nuclease family protein n=1 Tax=Streptomyces sp. NPDC051643 TaxID=3365665 RepID=UPI0037B52B00
MTVLNPGADTQHGDRNFWDDPTLSYRAKGILGLIASYEERSTFSAEFIATHSRDGMTAVKAALRELEHAGRLHRVQRREAGGTWGATAYVMGNTAPTVLEDASGWAYAIADRSSSYVKIGCSADPRTRLAVLQTGWPGVLEILWQERGGRALEVHLHNHFAARRVRGEWFDFEGHDTVTLITDAAAAFPTEGNR